MIPMARIRADIPSRKVEDIHAHPSLRLTATDARAPSARSPPLPVAPGPPRPSAAHRSLRPSPPPERSPRDRGWLRMLRTSDSASAGAGPDFASRGRQRIGHDREHGELARRTILDPAEARVGPHREERVAPTAGLRRRSPRRRGRCTARARIARPPSWRSGVRRVAIHESEAARPGGPRRRTARPRSRRRRTAGPRTRSSRWATRGPAHARSRIARTGARRSSRTGAAPPRPIDGDPSGSSEQVLLGAFDHPPARRGTPRR